MLEKEGSGFKAPGCLFPLEFHVLPVPMRASPAAPPSSRTPKTCLLG